MHYDMIFLKLAHAICPSLFTFVPLYAKFTATKAAAMPSSRPSAVLMFMRLGKSVAETPLSGGDSPCSMKVRWVPERS